MFSYPVLSYKIHVENVILLNWIDMAILPRRSYTYMVGTLHSWESSEVIVI